MREKCLTGRKIRSAKPDKENGLNGKEDLGEKEDPCSPVNFLGDEGREGGE